MSNVVNLNEWKRNNQIQVRSNPMNAPEGQVLDFCAFRKKKDPSWKAPTPVAAVNIPEDFIDYSDYLRTCSSNELMDLLVEELESLQVGVFTSLKASELFTICTVIQEKDSAQYQEMERIKNYSIGFMPKQA